MHFAGYALALLFFPQPPAEAPPSLDDLVAEARKAPSREAAGAAWQAAWEQAQRLPAADERRYLILKELTGLAIGAKAHDEAENWLLQALHWVETTQGMTDLRFAQDQILLAYLCKARDQFDRGLSILQRAMANAAKQYGFESLEVADILSRMADFEVARKEFARAEGVLWNSIRIREKIAGPEHFTLAPELEKLGSVLNVERKYDQAQPVFARGLVLRERMMGPEVELVNLLDGLAYAQFGLRKYEDSERNYRRIAAIWTAAMGPSHPMVAATLDKLVVLYRHQKLEAQAREAYGQAVAIRAQNLAESYAREAGERLARGRQPEAVALYRAAHALLLPNEPLHAKLLEAVNGQLKSLRPTGASRSAKR